MSPGRSGRTGHRISVTRRLRSVARVFAIANQKGGVAKTTTTQTVGLALADLGERVLLVDLDPQACLTFALGLEPESCAPTLHDVLLERVKATDAIVPSESLAFAETVIAAPEANDAPLAGAVKLTVGGLLGAVTVIVTAADVVVAPRLSVATAVSE